jgi:hypothetical protein
MPSGFDMPFQKCETAGQPREQDFDSTYDSP